MTPAPHASSAPSRPSGAPSRSAASVAARLMQIDAVCVGTPDHTHAPAAAMALRLKKHTYCEKPLSHTIVEARTLTKLAAENKLVTQMGNQIHSAIQYRLGTTLIKEGAIGKIKELMVRRAV